MNRYKILRTKEEYYSDWEEETLKELTPELMEQIYTRYCVKQEVFTRDNFLCKNEECITPTSPMTLHHVKFQKNGGKDSARNCITLCNSCHKAFHRGKKSVIFDGMSYKIHKENKINWKEVCRVGKQVRKENKELHGYKISWKLIMLLMKFLERDYSNANMDD